MRIRATAYRRKREGKTDYKKRLRLLESGKPRVVVRASLTNVLMQIIEYQEQGDKVLASAHSRDLKKLGWNYSLTNIPAAYLTGILLAKKAREKNIGECIFDIGLKPPVKGAKVFGALKGVVDGGVKIPHSEEILPSEERIAGKHIAAFGTKLKTEKEAYEKAFSGYVKANALPENIVQSFEIIKKKIMGA